MDLTPSFFDVTSNQLKDMTIDFHDDRRGFTLCSDVPLHSAPSSSSSTKSKRSVQFVSEAVGTLEAHAEQQAQPLSHASNVTTSYPPPTAEALSAQQERQSEGNSNSSTSSVVESGGNSAREKRRAPALLSPTAGGSTSSSSSSSSKKARMIIQRRVVEKGHTSSATCPPVSEEVRDDVSKLTKDAKRIFDRIGILCSDATKLAEELVRWESKKKRYLECMCCIWSYCQAPQYQCLPRWW